MKGILFFLVLTFNPFLLQAQERHDLEIKATSVFTCQGGRSLSGSLYESYCKKHHSYEKTAYVHFSPSEKILLHPEFLASGKLGSVREWCEYEINDGRVAPSCTFRLTPSRSYNVQSLYFPAKRIEDNFYSINLTSVKPGAYHVQLVESGTGSQAMSQIFTIEVE